jgi:hypothetical protein
MAAVLIRREGRVGVVRGLGPICALDDCTAPCDVWRACVCGLRVQALGLVGVRVIQTARTGSASSDGGCARMHAQTHTHTHTHTCVHTSSHTHTRMRAHTHAHAHPPGSALEADSRGVSGHSSARAHLPDGHRLHFLHHARCPSSPVFCRWKLFAPCILLTPFGHARQCGGGCSFR